MTGGNIDITGLLIGWRDLGVDQLEGWIWE
jgi:hypothetical protein